MLKNIHESLLVPIYQHSLFRAFQVESTFPYSILIVKVESQKAQTSIWAIAAYATEHPNTIQLVHAFSDNCNTQ